jgi:dTDP-glucose 4,6-dehydratase
MKNKILITGSEGFIGSHLVEYLVKKGYSVKAFILYNSFNNKGWLEQIDKKILSEVEIFFGDIRSNDSTDLALKNCCSVMHLASLIGIPYSYETPKSYIDTNIKGTLNILQSSLKNNIDDFIHTSTSEVYGNAKVFPINENSSLLGQSPYSASKIAADQIAYSFYCSYDMPLRIIRPFNTYGPRQSLRAIIPSITSQVLFSKKSELFLGSLYPKRDLTFVKDTIRAFELMLLKKDINGEVINIGSGFEITIKDLAQLISKICNKKLVFKKDKKRIRPEKSEVNRLLCDNSKAKKLLNWKPEIKGIKGLEVGLSETIDWILSNKNFGYKDPKYQK